MTTPSSRPQSFSKPRTGLVLSAVALALVASGCSSLQPMPLREVDLASANKTDRVAARADVPPLAGALTLEEAIARALKFNLDRRTRLMEEAISVNQLDASRYDLLPKLTAQAGYHARDNDLTVNSRDSVTGASSLANPSISSDRSHTRSELGMSWNLLDFGTSYYQARQNSDRVLVAAERRRKAMHLLVQDVRTAFWRTASAQRLQGEIRGAIALAKDALADARKAEAERVRSPLDSLRYQRQVMESLRLLEATNQELTSARIELLHLINLPLAADVRVTEPSAAPGRAILELPVERLEDLAAARNPEHREQVYNVRIANDEARKSIARLFPGLSVNLGANYDTDSYLIHQRWNEAGVSLSFNLFNLVAAPSQMRLAEAGTALAEQRRMASQMAVLAQVNIARLQYENALQQYESADAVADVDQRISVLIKSRGQAQVQSKLEVVANQTTAILSLLRRYQSLAQAHSAASRLQATLGVEPEIGDTSTASLAELTGIFGAAIKAWDQGKLPH